MRRLGSLSPTWQGVRDRISKLNPAQGTHGGNGLSDAFVAKVNLGTSGSAALVWSTYLGGADRDPGQALAVDSAGGVYVGGVTASTNFPVQAALQSTNTGGTLVGFLTKYNASSGNVVYSTYLGGTGYAQVTGLAVDGSQRPYVVGSTTAANLPTTADGLQPTRPNNTNASFEDGFVLVLNPAGNGLDYGTYLGGNNQDRALGIALSSDAFAVTGETASANFPTTAGAYDTTNAPGLWAAFVSKFSPLPSSGGGGNPIAYDETYEYDQVGNFVSKAGVAYSGYGPGAGNSGHAHAAATVGGQRYGYDANGNLLTGGGRTFVWNSENQPTSITGPDTVTAPYLGNADEVSVAKGRYGATRTTVRPA